ncbi:MAG: 2Fe-2S iron-sulfur cluster binding domain-containing protein [Rhodocyclaceae bacterium]|nr:2Fe-2S iron-sulfur cluster binding domain-containing protein [Rhodocyclaceae bacterium]MBX3667717.1 2Fe-2S iron-sulfur cluster binding domain-containing protein [Rhodocyclaceae bacterium]
MQWFRVTIEETGETFECSKDDDLLSGMRNSLCRKIPIGCCNGGCGACRISVTSGEYRVRKMNRAVVSESEQASGCVLACRVYPQSDLQLKVLGRKWLLRSAASTQPATGGVVEAEQQQTEAERRN